MKKAVFAWFLAVFVLAGFGLVFAAEKDDELALRLIEAAKDYINNPLIEPLEPKQLLKAVESLVEKSGWTEIDGLAVFLDKTSREIHEKSKELAFVYLDTKHEGCLANGNCSPEISIKLEEIYQEWQFQQAVRLHRIFYVLRPVKQRTAALEKKAEVDKIRNSRLLSFALDLKPSDTDEEVLRKYNQPVRRNGR